MSNPTPEENDELSHLTHQINKLNTSVISQMVRQARMSKANRKLIWALAFSLILDIVITIILGIGFAQMQTQANQLDVVTNRIHYNQTVQRQKALCPLYQLFRESWDTPKERDAARARSSSPEAFDHAVKVINKSYDALKCAEFRGGGFKPGR